jgi:head-tail adaptor
MSCGAGEPRREDVVLNRALVLEAAEDVPDGAGGCTRTWVVLGTLWGQVTPRSGRLAGGDAGAVSVNGFSVLLRGAPEGSAMRPRPGQRLRMGNRVLKVLAATEDDGTGRYLRALCEEEVGV